MAPRTRDGCTVAGRPRRAAHLMRAASMGSCTSAARRPVCDNRVDPSTALAMDPKILNDLNARMREVFAQSPAADLEKNLRAMLGGVFSRLDLVTREEFDVQREVLLRTREQ